MGIEDFNGKGNVTKVSDFLKRRDAKERRLSPEHQSMRAFRNAIYDREISLLRQIEGTGAKIIPLNREPESQ